MAGGMVKAGSYDSIFGSDYHSDSKKLLTRINISTGMTPKDLAKVCKVAMPKSYPFFPCPSGTLSSIQRAQYFCNTICCIQKVLLF